MSLEISDIRFFKPSGDTGKIRAMLSFKLCDCLFVTGCKLIEGKNGLFLGFPSRKVEKDGQTSYKDICFPASKGVRDLMLSIILTEYEAQKVANSALAAPAQSVPTDDIPF